MVAVVVLRASSKGPENDATTVERKPRRQKRRNNSSEWEASNKVPAELKAVQALLGLLIKPCILHDPSSIASNRGCHQ